MKKILKVIFVVLLILTTSGCESSKSDKIDEALEKKQLEKNKDTKKVKNDKTKPIITSSSDSVSFEANKTIDLDNLLNCLSAEDNVDGDITNKIKQESTTLVQHQEGEYEVLYSVKDRAGNKAEYTLIVKITSKYDSAEKNRLMNAVNGYNSIKVNKNLTDMFYSNIISNENGNVILFDYSGDNSQGNYEYGRIVYFSEDGHIQELSEDSSYPAELQGTKYEYDEENLKDFMKYYHLS